MNKTYIWVGLIVIIIFIILALVYLGNNGKKALSNPLPAVLNISPAQALGKLASYTDDSGFKFSYPEELKVSRIDSSDQSVYSSLEAKLASPPGAITIQLTSSTLKSFDDWYKSLSLKPKPSEVSKLKLADLDAVQLKLGDKLITAALDKDTLITLSATPSSNDKLSQAYQKIISSFVFVPPASTSDTSSAGGGDVIFEGEEQVQ